MSAIVTPRFTDGPGTASPRRLWAHEPRFAATAALLLMLLAPMLLAMQWDTRQFAGIDVWTKPVKFAIALIVYLATLAWYARWMPAGSTATRTWRLYAAVVASAVLLEMAWIAGAAMFGIASHFNRSHPVMMILYPIMGVVAVTLTSASLVMGVMIMRHRDSALPKAMRQALGLGLIVTFFATVIVAGYLSSTEGHLVGGDGSDAGGLPLMGWSRDAGDLRVAHFFATHAMHLVPMAMLIVGWVRPGTAQRLAPWAIAAGYALLIAFTFVQALQGRPFL